MLKLRFKPDSATLGSLVKGFCRMNKVNEAVSFVNKMVELGYKVDIAAYNTIIDSLCQTRRATEALSFFVQRD